MSEYEIVVRIKAENIQDAKFIASCIGDPGAQVADVARQCEATIMSVKVEEGV